MVIQLARFTLDCNVFFVATADCDSVYPYVLLGNSLELLLLFNPMGPVIAFFDVPFSYEPGCAYGDVLDPSVCWGLISSTSLIAF